MQGATFIRCVVIAGVVGGISSAARADVIYETADPFGGVFGLIGYDVSSEQSVAVRFTPGDPHRLDRIGLWFMNNDFSGATHPLVTVTLRCDETSEKGSIPGDEVIETWTFNVSAVGWDPMLESLDSIVRPPLEAGTPYWIVAESEAPGGLDGVWSWASTGTGFMSICNGDPCSWSPGGMSAVAATIVEGTSAMVGDVDGDGAVGFVDLLGVLAAWGTCPLEASCTSCPADFDRSGVIDFSDLLTLLAAWTG